MNPSRAGLAQEVAEQVVEGFHAVDHRIKVVDPPITDDFTLTLGPNTIGAAQYLAFLEKRAEADYSSRHLVSNFRVAAVQGADVTVTFTATVHRLDAGASEPTVNVIDFTDVWTDASGEWRQRSRTIQPAFGSGSR